MTASPSARIAAVYRGRPAPDGEQQAATALLVDLLAAAARHGVTPGDLDYVVDLPAACVQVVRAKGRRT